MLKLIVSGILNQLFPVAHATAISVEPIPVAKAPNAPYVHVWLSAPMIMLAGMTKPFSGII